MDNILPSRVTFLGESRCILSTGLTLACPSIANHVAHRTQSSERQLSIRFQPTRLELGSEVLHDWLVANDKVAGGKNGSFRLFLSRTSSRSAVPSLSSLAG